MPALRFSCTGCGRCCTGDDRQHYIETGVHEREAIRRFLGISPAWFRRRYLRHRPGEEIGLRLERGGCVFLTAGRHCRIYPVRPLQCRSYPFWPEIVNSPAKWKAEAKRCEGIGRGTVVPVGRAR